MMLEKEEGKSILYFSSIIYIIFFEKCIAQKIFFL